ncbi:MAG: DUF368 domain-containing protein [Breznakibacter sp.]
MSRKPNDYLMIGLKGIAMGAADVVPGVSGGTIAFISGIYEELLTSIRNLPACFPLIFKKGQGIAAFWRKANLNFLLVLVLGIGISFLSLIRLMTWLLEQHPIPTWAFFFGLILASTVYVFRDVEPKRTANWLALLVGAGAAYWVTVMPPSDTPQTYWFIFLSGAIAICAMILPGISGSFILLLMGKYVFMMDALISVKIDIIVTFVAGAAIGIMLFSNVLIWLLKKYHQVTVALLGGTMIGSLNKIWPWKETVSSDSHDKELPLAETNVWPQKFQAVTGEDHLALHAIVSVIIGFVIVFAIEYVAQRMKRQ